MRFWNVVIAFNFNFRKLRLCTSSKYRYYIFLPFEKSTYTRNLNRAFNHGGKKAEKEFYLEYVKELKMVYLTYYILLSNLAVMLLIVDIVMGLYFVSPWITIPILLASFFSWLLSKRELNAYVLNDLWYSLNEQIYDEAIKEEEARKINTAGLNE